MENNNNNNNSMQEEMMKMFFPLVYMMQNATQQQSADQQNSFPNPFMCGWNNQQNAGQPNFWQPFPFAWNNGWNQQNNLMNPMNFFEMVKKYDFVLNMIDNAKAKTDKKSISYNGFNIPMNVIQNAINMEASPKALEGLQKTMDKVFEWYTKPRQQDNQ